MLDADRVRDLWLITSSAFVDQELSAEFGHLPPAFLPVGTKRLYEYQLEQLGRDQTIYLMVPESYALANEDQNRLRDSGTKILQIPDGLSLGNAIVFAINLIGNSDCPIRILHGDTLINGIPMSGLDEIGVSTVEVSYSWTEAYVDHDQIVGLETFAAGIATSPARPIVCGYFSFSHSNALVRGIVRARGDFISGILSYARDYPLSAINVKDWLDFGHLQTFFRSRRLLASARAFNTLQIDGRVVRKLSTDTAKMQAEAKWLNDLPPALRIYSARLIDSGKHHDKAFYETEYEYLPTLSELFVFGTLGRASWTHILQSCHDFLSTCAAETGPGSAGDALQQLTVGKTGERLQRFAAESGFEVNRMLRYDGKPMPSLSQIAEDLESYVDLRLDRPQNIMHGDFCFSNVLYSSRVQRIRVIDPRGYIATGSSTIYGDIRYDIAKLSHSIMGRYDQIIAGRYAMAPDDNGRFSISFESTLQHSWIEDAWTSFEVAGVVAGSAEIQAITVGLFLSMLPLHADRPDRQRAFIANALRLYAKLETTMS